MAFSARCRSSVKHASRAPRRKYRSVASSATRASSTDVARYLSGGRSGPGGIVKSGTHSLCFVDHSSESRGPFGGFRCRGSLPAWWRLCSDTASDHPRPAPEAHGVHRRVFPCHPFYGFCPVKRNAIPRRPPGCSLRPYLLFAVGEVVGNLEHARCRLVHRPKHLLEEVVMVTSTLLGNLPNTEAPSCSSCIVTPTWVPEKWTHSDAFSYTRSSQGKFGRACSRNLLSVSFTFEPGGARGSI